MILDRNSNFLGAKHIIFYIFLLPFVCQDVLKIVRDQTLRDAKIVIYFKYKIFNLQLRQRLASLIKLC